MLRIKLLLLSLTITLLACVGFCAIGYFILRLAEFMLSELAPGSHIIPGSQSTGAWILDGALIIALPMGAGVLLEIRGNLSRGTHTR